MDRAPRRLAPWLPLLLLALAAAGLYGAFLSSPLVFDDHDFFTAQVAQYGDLQHLASLRWLPYASFEWTLRLAGDELHWLRLGNLVLHGANGIVLFLFLRRLYAAVLPEAGVRAGVAPDWLAFAGALIFVVHPTAAYGVAYLVQRTILMATLFTLLSWRCFLEGLLSGRQAWWLASALAYLLAVLSKEHAIMAPALAGVLLLLLRRPDPGLLLRLAPTVLAYGAIAAFIVLQVKSAHIIGRAHEPNSLSMLSALDLDARERYPLSVLTQGALYFKYLLLWLWPDVTRMSVDLREAFATRLWAWPQTAVFAAFVAYPFAALALLLRRGRAGLLGFALLCPWLLFATELSTVRVQEIFVLYRSYLWMPALVGLLPLWLQRLPARFFAAITAAVVLALLPLSWNRLATFADPVALWDEALRLAPPETQAADRGRIHHNRGVALLGAKRAEEAVRDFTAGLALLPGYTRLYNDRGAAYLELGRYPEALNDFDRAIWYDPGYYNPYLGRARAYQAMGNLEAARRDFAQACRLGMTEVCDRR